VNGRVLEKEVVLAVRREQNPEVFMSKILNACKRTTTWARPSATPIPRPLTHSHIELCEHSPIMLDSGDSFGNATGNVEIVTACNVSHSQLLNETFQ
jgi:hypothetical protein